MNEPVLIHATSVVIDGRALLLTGASGSGKSDLALRLIDRGALLLSDDYTALELQDGIVHARAAVNIAGRIEVRGVGIIDMAFADDAPVALVLALDEVPNRMPPETIAIDDLLGRAIPRLGFAPFDISAAIKAEHALRTFGLKASVP